MLIIVPIFFVGVAFGWVLRTYWFPPQPSTETPSEEKR